jgi:hypothetical protein
MRRNLTIALSAILVSSSFASDAKDFTFNGWVDFYYQYDFNHSPFGTNLTGRGFDNRANSFELANAEFNIKYAKKGAPFAVVLDLGVGRNVQINNGLDAANGNRNQIVQQLYVSIPFKDGSTLDLGKFNTWIGSESVYTVDNPNYSIGTLFNYGQPNWHVGLRWAKPLTDTSTVSFFAVNGWNETNDTNSSKTFGASLSKNVTKKLSTTFGYIGGQEGTNGIGLPNAGLSNVHMGDLIATYVVSDRHSLVFNGDYASSSGANNGHWYGLSLNSNHKLSEMSDASVRFSAFHDPDGLRGTGASISSWTGTYNLKTSTASTFRFEFRLDQASASIFESGASGFSKNRATLTIAHVLRF